MSEFVTTRDIEPSWEVSALCSVCPDTIGDIEQTDPDTLECKDCGSWWTIEGAYQGTEPKQ
jgi:hypothetical protein